MVKLFESFRKILKEYYGRRAAGVLAIAEDTGRILIAFRSPDVSIGNCWGTIGGKVDGKDGSYNKAALREFKEETGYKGNIKLIPAYVFKDQEQDFEYHNFIGLLPQEFKPTVTPYSWETTAFGWASLKELLRLDNKHPGLEELLLDPATLAILQKYASTKKKT